MTLYDRRREKLIADLKNKEYRDAFVAEHIYTGIPFQIKALRKQKERNWTQEELGKRANMFQERIRVLENPDNESLSIKTLLRLASAFDIGLMIRFAPISDLVKWDLELSEEALQVESYKDEAYFQEIDDVIGKAREFLRAPDQRPTHIYLAHDNTREKTKKELNPEEIYGYKNKPSDALREVAR